MIQKDKHDGKVLADFYRDALVMITAHLTMFYQEYADETGLSLEQVDQQINSWDLEHFKLAINAMLKDHNPDDSLAARLQASYDQAAISRRHMMTAIITAGMAIASDEAESFGRGTIKASYRNGYRERSGKAVPDVANRVKQPVHDYASRVWIHNDQMTIRMQQLMNRSLQRGTDKQVWQKLITIKTVDQPREIDNLASEMNKEVTQTQAMLRNENSSVDNEASITAYRDQDIHYGVMVTEPGACDKCLEIAGDGPWLLDETPNIPEDTHLNCRCNIVGTDVHGNIIAPLIDDKSDVA